MSSKERVRIKPETVDQILDAVAAFRAVVHNALEAVSAVTGWCLSPYDPKPLVECFPHLQLRVGYRLAAYQFMTGGNGNGVVFALPEGRDLPPPLELDLDESAGPWADMEDVPAWADRDLAKYLEGDGSAQSYFEASLFMREAAEVGAMWHGCSWSTHTLISRSPSESPEVEDELRGGSLERLTWLEPAPTDWRPAVYVPEGGSVEVEFFTYSGLGREAIYRHRDTYSEGYQFVATAQPVAEGPGGYVF